MPKQYEVVIETIPDRADDDSDIALLIVKNSKLQAEAAAESFRCLIDRVVTAAYVRPASSVNDPDEEVRS